MAGIDNIRTGQPMTTSRGSARTESGASNANSATGSKASSSDSVSLSQQSKAIGQLHQEMATQPSFDGAKVAAIKEAIANGSYKVDPEKLADNMMKYENELGGL